jgi:hypothetical protein
MIDDDDDLYGSTRCEAALQRRRDGYLTRRVRLRDAYDDPPVAPDRTRGGGFGLGGGGACLVMLGLLLMAIAYFGVNEVFDGGYGWAGPPDPYLGGPYDDTIGGLTRRPMLFMGGGFLFLAGWMMAIASRMRLWLITSL